MTCVRSFLTSAALGAACLAPTARPLSAQQPVPTPPASPSVPAAAVPLALLAPYRAPLLALVQPPMSPDGNGVAGALPRDRPAIVLRFAPGEPDDPLDVRSLVVAVDGAERTALFQTTAAQAWGPLASDEQLARGELPAGPHRVVARICSTRGVCATADVQVVVVPGVVGSAAVARDDEKPSLTRRALGAVLTATRKLLMP